MGKSCLSSKAGVAVELKFQIEFAFLQEMPGKAGWLSLNFGVDFLHEGFIVCINFVA